MEKLIELLNEYAEQLKFISKRKIEDNKVVVGNAGPAMSELMLISKSYGFIKWLVDNDKLKDFNLEISDVGSGGLNADWQEYYYTEEESLLMRLSISDTPIQDLIDLLK